MAKKPATAEHYRITIRPGEVIRVGGVALRPGGQHTVSHKVYEANQDRIESAEALS